MKKNEAKQTKVEAPNESTKELDWFVFETNIRKSVHELIEPSVKR
jgi:hypothetical protein